MGGSILERQVESAVQDMFDDRAVRFIKSIRRFAAKQGGESAIQNYQLLGKRVLIVVGVVIVAVQGVSFIISRRNESKRIERVVRRVLEEERQKEEADA